MGSEIIVCVELKEVHVSEGIHSVQTHHRSQIKHGGQLRREFDDIPPLRCQSDELQQVCTHLIHNALQAMGGGTTFKVYLPYATIAQQ